MRRAPIFLVLAVLLVQPSLWTLCASHCAPFAHSAALAASATASEDSEDCHAAASPNHDGSASSEARLSAHDGCAQPPSVEAQPFAELTRHDLATATIQLTAAAGVIAHVTFAPPTSAAGLLRATGSFSLDSPRTSAPVVLRI
jgi:hypothetical protein